MRLPTRPAPAFPRLRHRAGEGTLEAMRRAACLILLGFALASGAACSDDDEPAPGGVSDEAYLAVLCSGLQRFSDVLIARSTPDEIRAAIREYVEELRGLTPPSDIARFHEQYIAYLEAAEAEPLRLASPAPLPENSARRRLAALEGSVEECKNPTFFQEPAP